MGAVRCDYDKAREKSLTKGDLLNRDEFIGLVRLEDGPRTAHDRRDSKAAEQAAFGTKSNLAVVISLDKLLHELDGRLIAQRFEGGIAVDGLETHSCLRRERPHAWLEFPGSEVADFRH